MTEVKKQFGKTALWSLLWLFLQWKPASLALVWCIHDAYFVQWKTKSYSLDIGFFAKRWRTQHVQPPKDHCSTTHFTSHVSGRGYIFGKKENSFFQKYLVFHGYFRDIYLAVIVISHIFPTFFSHVWNHIPLILWFPLRFALKKVDDLVTLKGVVLHTVLVTISLTFYCVMTQVLTQFTAIFLQGDDILHW